MDPPAHWIEERAQLGAVLAILLHLLMQHRRCIRRGAQFEHAIRAKRKKLLPFFLRQRVEAFLSNPGEVRLASRAVKESKPR